MSRRILVVEDDDDTQDYLAKALRETGYTVEATASGREGLMHAIGGGFDAHGARPHAARPRRPLAPASSVRAAGVQTPAIILTAMSAIDERVRGLRAGADDYVVKPFSYAELSARLEAVHAPPGRDPGRGDPPRLRRPRARPHRPHRPARRAARIELLPREFQMLEYLMRRQGRVVTRTMLLEGVWDYRFDPRTNVIDVHISRLRRKIDAEGEPPLIHTVRGSGYKLAAAA